MVRSVGGRPPHILCSPPCLPSPVASCSHPAAMRWVLCAGAQDIVIPVYISPHHFAKFGMDRSPSHPKVCQGKRGDPLIRFICLGALWCVRGHMTGRKSQLGGGLASCLLHSACWVHGWVFAGCQI